MWLALGLAALLILLLAAPRRPRQPAARPARGRARARRLPATCCSPGGRCSARSWRSSCSSRSAATRSAANLPIELEPYRIVIALVLACWFCALPPTRRCAGARPGSRGRSARSLVAMLLSMAAEHRPRQRRQRRRWSRTSRSSSSYLLVVYFIASVVRSRRDLDRMLQAARRRRHDRRASLRSSSGRPARTSSTGTATSCRSCTTSTRASAQARGTGVRARGSAQHPIALGAALVMLRPARASTCASATARRIWLGCAALLTLGALSTGSRTGTTMLIALLVSFLCDPPARDDPAAALAAARCWS